VAPRSVAAIFVAVAILAAGAASPGVPQLSRTERAERIRLLPDEERRWLEEIARPIILPEEENLFLLLSQKHEREIFKEEFWKRRETAGLLYPLGPGYRTRYRELLRLADTTYDGRREDAGRMVIAHGEPTAINELAGCQDMFRDLQIWIYRSVSAGNSAEKPYFFYRRSPGAPRKLWDVTVPSSDVFQPGSCRRRFEDLKIDCTPADRLPGKDPCILLTNCHEVCGILRTYLDIKTRQGTAMGGREESATALAPPGVELESLQTLAARFPSIQDPKARHVGIEAVRTSTEEAPSLAATPASNLTPEEIRERILHLDPKYREFLDLAGLMFTGDELSRFLLMSDSAKDTFIREFWRRHR
jgi:GWxTD domain-containing protein